jgi:hypothetical protein
MSNPIFLPSDSDDPPFSPYTSRRVTQIFQKPELYVEGARFSDIVQGKNC